MEYGAIDLHLRRSQIRILTEDETVVLDRRIDTTRASSIACLAGGRGCGFCSRAVRRASGSRSTSRRWATR